MWPCLLVRGSSSVWHTRLLEKRPGTGQTAPVSKTRRLRLRPAASPKASLSISVPQAAASVGQPRSISRLGRAGRRPAGCAGRPGGLGFDRGTVPQRTRSESAGVAKGEPCRSATSASAWNPIAHTSAAVAGWGSERPRRRVSFDAWGIDANWRRTSASALCFLRAPRRENDGDADQK